MHVNISPYKVIKMLIKHSIILGNKNHIHETHLTHKEVHQVVARHQDFNNIYNHNDTFTLSELVLVVKNENKIFNSILAATTKKKRKVKPKEHNKSEPTGTEKQNLE